MTFSGCVVCPYLLNSAVKATSRQVAAGQGFNAHSFMKATAGQQTVLEKLCLESCQPAELGFMLPSQLLPNNTAPDIDFPINRGHLAQGPEAHITAAFPVSKETATTFPL